MSEGLRKFLRDNHYMTLAMLPMQVNHMSLGIILLGDHKRREFSDNEYRLLEMATHQITAQIHNARLHTTTQEALVQGLEQLDLIEGISRQISQALDLELIIQNVLEAALQSTHADFAAFALPSDETEHFEIIGREVIGDQLRPYKTLLKKGSGVTGYVAEHGEMCLIEDNEASEFYVIPEGTHYPFRSSLAVPLLKAETVVGVLNLESQKTNFFTLEHAKFLNSLAGHAVISIDNADLLEKREEQIQIMRAILDSTHDGIILLDPNGMVQDANHAADTLTQLAISQHLQKPLSTLIERNDKQDEVLQQLVQTYLKFPESLHEKEHMLEREEGDLYIKTFVYRVKDNFGKTVGRLLVLRDITKQKDLQDFHDRIQNMVLHDLRGPLSAIMTSMYVSMDIVARPDDEPLETTLLPILQVSLNSANELLQLVETLRELPTITEFQVNPDTVVLGDLAQTGRDTLKAIMIESQVIVDIETPENETVYVDRGLVRRVFVNLLHNAVKFTPEDGRILIRADYESQKDGYLRVQIADTGPGIPEKDRERIFGEGEQVEGQKPERGVKGLGIGLNFCKMAVEAHGGRIWVEKDSPLSGACFAFTLPLTDDVLNAHLVEVAQLAQEIE